MIHLIGRFPVAFAAGLALLSASGRDSAAADPRPNVILILADDFGWGDLSCYNGDALAKTPQLDRMAKEGVRFTQFYVASPICSPSRCGIITGRWPARHRITSYLQTRAGNAACEMADFLDPSAPALPRTLKASGYATAHVGKWHLGGGRDVVHPPKFAAYGYDRGLGTWESPEPHPDITATDWIWSDKDKIKRWDRTEWMVDRTLDFLKANPEKPCFVNLWLDDTHTPWVPSAEDTAVGKNGRTVGKPDTPERLRGVLTAMDAQLGRMLDALRDAKSSRPTVVLFLGDNGPLPTFNQRRAGGLRGSKLSLYEGGIRTPLIAWGPGVVPAGVTNEATVVAAVDLLPTLAGLCGARLPEGYSSDGEDLGAALRGESPHRTKPLFWEYGRNTKSFAYPAGKNRSPNVAVRDGSWKLLVNADGTGAELYDLAIDPRESHDVAASRPEVAGPLREKALAWRKALP